MTLFGRRLVLQFLINYLKKWHVAQEDSVCHVVLARRLIKAMR